jgi:hypothetical protein
VVIQDNSLHWPPQTLNPSEVVPYLAYYQRNKTPLLNAICHKIARNMPLTDEEYHCPLLLEKREILQNIADKYPSSYTGKRIMKKIAQSPLLVKDVWL